MRLLGLLFVLLALPATAAAQAPDQDAFYVAPAGLSATPNGTVLKERRVNVTIPAVTARQLQYRSTDAKGVPIAPVTTLVEPVLPWLGVGVRPLVVYQPDYDGLAPSCMPSYALRTGSDPDLPMVLTLLQLGYAVAVTDHEGPQNAFGAGPVGGHVVLDATRAAQASLPAGTPTALLGFSGGGQASAWAAEQLDVYAPELRIAGIAAGAVTPDPEQLIRFTDGKPAAGVGFAALAGLQRQFSTMYLRPLLNDAGRATIDRVGGQCADDIRQDYRGARLLGIFNDPTLGGLFKPRVQRVFEANRLGKNPPSVPVYLWHSADDEQVPVAGADALAERWCRNRTTVYYARSGSGSHESSGLFGALTATSWIADRFAGTPAPSNCGSTPTGQIASYCPGGATTKFRLHRLHGQEVILAEVYRDGERILVRRGEEVGRRVVVRKLTPGFYRFTVRWSTRDYDRTRHFRRDVICKQRAI